jgi:hypothetical protein
MSNQVAVFNDNIYPYKEKFKDDEINIPSKGHILMERQEAVQFLGQMNAPVLGADNEHLPQGFKMLRIIQNKKDLEAVESPVIKCHQCNDEFSTQELLDDHIRTEHIDKIEDKDFAKDFSEKKVRPKPKTNRR